MNPHMITERTRETLKITVVRHESTDVGDCQPVGMLALNRSCESVDVVDVEDVGVNVVGAEGPIASLTPDVPVGSQFLKLKKVVSEH